MQKRIEFLSSDMIGNRQNVRDNSQKTEDIIKIELSKITMGYNPRQIFEGIDELAESLLENGQVTPGRVEVLKDGNFVLVDGERRFRALKLLEEGGNEVYFKAVVNTSKTTELQRIVQIFATQDNKKLKPIEVANLIRTMINLGCNQTDVSKKIGKPVSFVSQMLEFSNESPAIQEHVKNGSISISTALQAKKKIKSTTDRVKAIDEAVGNNNGKKVTAENLIDSKGEKAKLIANEIRKVFQIIDVENKAGMYPNEKLVEIIRKHL